MDIDGWIKNQIEASISWNNIFPFNFYLSEYLTCLLFGGLNLQIEHHIAPSLNPLHLYYFKKKLKILCKKYNIKYTQENTFYSAFRQYYKWIIYCSIPRQ